MTFCYDLQSSDSETKIVSQIRLNVGDTVNATDSDDPNYVADGGVRPEGRNLADEELLKFYSEAGSVKGAAALACDTLATEWSGAGERVSLRGYSIDTTKKAEQYRIQARKLRKQKVLFQAA